MSIPTDRPVYGSDLVQLQQLIGSSAQDMQCILAMTPNEWANAVNTNISMPVKSRQVSAMARIWTSRPDLVYIPKFPTPAELNTFMFKKTGEEMSRAHLAIMLGNQKTAGIRYMGIKDGSRKENPIRGDSNSKVSHWAWLIKMLVSEGRTKAECSMIVSQIFNLMRMIGQHNGVPDVFKTGSWNPKVARKEALKKKRKESDGAEKKLSSTKTARKVKRVTKKAPVVAKKVARKNSKGGIKRVAKKVARIRKKTT